MILKQQPEDFIVEEIPMKKPSSGPFTYFLLKKRNLTTEYAMQRLAQHYKLPRKMFSYAGLKDKNAVTTQWCSARSEIESFKAKDWEVVVQGTAPEQINLGMLKGNKFIITVRECSEKELAAFKNPKKDFKNLFGEQRFGVHNVDIGRAFLQRKYRKATEIIIDTDNTYGPEVKKHLEQYNNDYVGALQKLPRKILVLYIHAYQSKLWNYMAMHFDDEEIPLIGFDSEFENDKVEEQYMDLLKEDNITMRDFVFKDLKELTAEGGMRKTNLHVDIKSKIENNTAILEFQLPPGSYATEIIRQLSVVA